MKEEVYKPGTYEIHELTIIGYHNDLNIKAMMIELNLYEDMFFPVMTGEVVINDSFNIISNLPVVEGDILRIHLKAGVSDADIIKELKTDELKLQMEIVKVENRTLVKQDTQVFILKLASVGWSNHSRTRISRGYKQKKYSEVVKEIFDDKLKIGTIHDNDEDDYTIKELNVEATEGTYSFLIPRWKPFRCFEWLAGRSRKGDACNFVFYEDRDEFNFVSIESLLAFEPELTFSTDPAIGDKNVHRYFSITAYTYEDTGDILHSAHTGMLGSRLLTYDLLHKTFTDYFRQGETGGCYKVSPDVFTYAEDFKKLTHCDGPGSEAVEDEETLQPLIPNEVSDTFATSPGNAKLTVVPVHTNAWENTESYEPEKYLRQRISQRRTWDYLKITAEAVGSFHCTVGMKITMNLRSPESQTKHEGEAMDTKLSGNYLVTALRRTFNHESYTMTMECTKDNLYRVTPDEVWTADYLYRVTPDEVWTAD